MHIFEHIEREEGQGLVEYALLLVLVAIVVIAILTILGSSVTLVFARVMGGFNGDTIDDGAVFMSADGTETDLGGSCRRVLENIKFVGTDNDGNLITDGGTVSVSMLVNGTPSLDLSGTANGNGVVTVAGPHTVSSTGNCPLKITMVKK